MKQCLMMSMQLCQETMQKHFRVHLTEFELGMYEQLCKSITAYHKVVEALYQQQLKEIEKEIEKG